MEAFIPTHGAKVEKERAEPLRTFLREHHKLIGAGTRLRPVTHLDIGRVDIEPFAQTVGRFFGQTLK